MLENAEVAKLLDTVEEDKVPPLLKDEFDKVLLTAVDSEIKKINYINN